MITGELARRAQRLTQERTPFVLATVVHARRPTSVRPGDCAIMLSDGTIEGFVGGVCAESSVRLHGLRVLETGEPLVLRLVPDGDEAAGACISDGGLREEDTVTEHNPCLSGGALEIFLDPQLPAPRLVVIGSAPIALALAEVAAAAGYEVARGSTDEVQSEPGDAALVVASHGSREEQILTAALSAGVPYVALVASRTRGEAVRAALELPDELRAQLHTPAGLDIGARTPSEIAIAILAQLVAGRRAVPAPAPEDVSLPLSISTASGSSARPAVPTSAGPATATDPICGMTVAITPKTPQRDGPDGPVYFCCEGCASAYAERQLHDAAPS